jgi:hypothetical protein
MIAAVSRFKTRGVCSGDKLMAGAQAATVKVSCRR